MAFLIRRSPINVSRRRLVKPSERSFGPKLIAFFVRNENRRVFISAIPNLTSNSTSQYIDILRDSRNVSSENEPNTSIVQAQVLDIEEQKVILQCLVNPDRHEFQVRSFDRELFEGMNGFEIGKFVEIEIQSQPGKRSYSFRLVDGANLMPLFDLDSMFESLIDSPIFQKMPPVDEGDI